MVFCGDEGGRWEPFSFFFFCFSVILVGFESFVEVVWRLNRLTLEFGKVFEMGFWWDGGGNEA